MDACFLTSRSISGVKELVPFIKARIFTCPKRNSGQFVTRKVASPISVNCSLSDSWKPLEDDADLFKDCVNNSTSDADWREFRARLVAGEQAATSEKDQPSWSNPDMVVDYQPSSSSLITIGSKWAHKIHEPETGCLLIATEKLDGVHIFEKTVILLLSVGPSGPIGVILNRPSLMSIKETKSTILDMAGTFSDKRLFFGGPLEEGLFLVSPRSGGDNEVGKSGVFRQVMKGLYYGTRESVGLAAEMVKRNLVGRSELRFFDGYCGWEKEQLKAEILGGYWTVAACSSTVVELGSAVQSHGLWDEVLGLIGPQTGSVI
ncbi:hypothetical protein AtNW77_Chr3g0190451 [Arabidopsis thaliana]|jgi:putative AlgH/UPF0301 family transcriptional regulator|uniref:AT3g29240/MXO21_9 n=4 Tax=Arabidopsis TaxID=3701 RepID=Q9LS71_ARATH|nr:PPR containing protein (DUF179) [Arabidopsis thaliana]NP_850648.1 PPR containing protein (DUF179) [Arabidopsis thaliana]KAG7627016.1 hypothetical protein ISN45_At03g031340 [Arabidopsis thaliana x Arabidopsis arenosa]KAG7632991.1 hypothetical protein ISN44_As03g030880 [Arabidopsis suecica]AAL84976.1 AT3g29240/MXO21_9 [Arabidopsis thaliana]AAM61482.1 unknown [Arabidopsis thaliana]AAM98077.1 AT3g29240/MXO21_9 [Arabidopsis thaliana]|eukprot:NP_566847.1 PPR containing protein (DUF179) [Arabidopsis thaliana]